MRSYDSEHAGSRIHPPQLAADSERSGGSGGALLDLRAFQPSREHQAAVDQDRISVAVLGRFKAGKSSFLNHLFGRGVLPVGVVPVTAAVTEIRYGARERASVRHQDGRVEEAPLDQIGAYISEKGNPENTRQVRLITVELPELRRFRGLNFVDTPGLESALSHNTQTSLDWLPHVGLALVAVSVDPPLSQRDIDLLKCLYQYTPKVAVLLTKADLLNERELAEVLEYVRTQLARNFAGTPQVFPYSTRPGWGRLRHTLEASRSDSTISADFRRPRRQSGWWCKMPPLPRAPW